MNETQVPVTDNGPLLQAVGWLLSSIGIAHPGHITHAAEQAEEYSDAQEREDEHRAGTMAMAAQLRKWANTYDVGA